MQKRIAQIVGLVAVAMVAWCAISMGTADATWNYGFPIGPAGDGGDVCGNYPALGVCGVHGATVPEAGSLVPGNVLQVAGPSSLTYAPLNLDATAGPLPISRISASGVGVLTSDGGSVAWLPSASGLPGLGGPNTVLYSDGGAAGWELPPPTAPANGSWSVAAWYLDPVSGSDANTCLTTGSACKTWGHLASLWGTYSPRLRQTTTVTYLSSSSDNSDPVYWNPYLEGGASAILTAPLPTATSTGTFSGLLAKNRASGQLLTANLTSGLSPGMLVVDITRGSRAWTHANTTGATWSLTQPTPTQTAPVASLLTSEDDTWANGDSFAVYAPIKINVGFLGAQLTDYNQTAFANGPYFYQATLYDPNGASNDEVVIGMQGVVFVESSIQRFVIGQNSNLYVGTNRYINCDISGGMTSGPIAETVVEAGQSRSPGVEISGNTVSFNNDFIASEHINVFGGEYGFVYLDSGDHFFGQGASSVRYVNSSGAPIVWGPGSIDVIGTAEFYYPSGAGKATSIFLNSGGLKLDGAPTAMSMGANGITTGIALTPANLDAVAGPTGFGGVAFNLRGASITNQSTVSGLTTPLTGFSIPNTAAPANGSWSVANWYIDPVGGSDSNSCTSSGSPCKTYAQVAQRWGTYCPRLRQATAIEFLNSQSDNTDPVYMCPYIENGAAVELFGVRGSGQQIATGTFSGVSARSQTGSGSLTTVTLTSGLTAGEYVVDNTRGSVAVLNTNTSGNVWTTSQPLLAVTPPHNATLIPEDTWVNGDSYTVYQPVKVNLVQVTPTFSENNTGFDNFVSIYALNAVSFTSGSPFDYLTLNGNVSFYESGIGRSITGAWNPTPNIRNNFINCDFVSSPVMMGGPVVQGGQYRNSTFFGAFGGSQLVQDFVGSNRIELTQYGNVSSVYIASGQTLQVVGDDVGISSGTPVIYGPGSFSLVGGTQFNYSGASSTPTQIFQLTGGITINGQSTACSQSATGVACGITISGPNLTAAAGPSGFGGTAFVPGGGSITNGNALASFNVASSVAGGVTGSGVWHSTGGALDTAASHGTPGQFLATTAVGTDTIWSSCSGDVSCSTTTPGKFVVNDVDGIAYPAGPLTPGNVPIASSSSAVTYGTLNLASSATVGGSILGTANQAPQPLGGDARGTTAAVDIYSLTGDTFSNVTLEPGVTLTCSGGAAAGINLQASTTGGIKSGPSGLVAPSLDTAGAGTEVIGGVHATQVQIGSTTAPVDVPSLAGGGTALVNVNNSGVLGIALWHVQTFTSNTTFTVPAGVNDIEAIGCGGTGGSGGSSGGNNDVSSAGIPGGASGGASAGSQLGICQLSTSGGDNLSISIGAFGAAGAPGAPGGPGGSSSVSDTTSGSASCVFSGSSPGAGAQGNGVVAGGGTSVTTGAGSFVPNLSATSLYPIGPGAGGPGGSQASVFTTNGLPGNDALNNTFSNASGGGAPTGGAAGALGAGSFPGGLIKGGFGGGGGGGGPFGPGGVGGAGGFGSASPNGGPGNAGNSPPIANSCAGAGGAGGGGNSSAGVGPNPGAPASGAAGSAGRVILRWLQRYAPDNDNGVRAQRELPLAANF